MSHEFQNTDGLVMTGIGGWHGLGEVVPEALGPVGAAKRAKIDWEVGLYPMFAEYNGKRVASDRFMVIRKDIGTCLGQVGDKYKPYQNMELARFCEALSREGHAKVETCGSIRGGQKVWFLLQRGSIDIRNTDTVKPYLLASSSHDGSSQVRILCTSVRVVCSNTLHLALSDMRDAVTEVMHSGDMKRKMQAAHEAVECFDEAVKFSGERMKHLAEKAATVDDLRDFWATAYQRDFGAIPTKPVTVIEKKHYDKGIESWLQVKARFDREVKVAGTTWWNVLNAYTGHIQHDVKVRAKNAEARNEKRVEQRLFGIVGDRSSEAFRNALALAG